MTLGDQVSGSGDQSKRSILLLKSAQIFNCDETLEADILIEDGLIRKISRNISTFGENVRVIDCQGKYVMPGGIDVNTHFLGKSNNISSIEDFYTGTLAALSGGTTTIIDTVEIDENSSTLIKKLNEIREKADSQVCCDYALHIAIKTFNEQVLSEMKTLINEYGINSFKIDLKDEQSNLHDDRVAYDLLKMTKQNGAILLVNASNGRLYNRKATDIYNLGITGPEGHQYASNEELEIDSVHHIITLSNGTNCPVLFTNVMSQGAVELIANSKSKNSIVYGEAISASLAVDGIQYFEKSWNHAAALLTDPPLSIDIYTGKKIIQNLATGGMDLVSSNHCKFTTKKKQIGIEDFRKIPIGITGVTERMMLVWDKGVNGGIFDGCQFVAITSSNAARIFNLYPRKGAIKEGSDADIIIWDPKIKRVLNPDEISSQLCVNIYENYKICGAPVIVVSNGKIVYENKILDVKPGCGKFLKLSPNSQYVYKKVTLKDKLNIQSLRRISRDPIEKQEEPKTDLSANNILTDPNTNNCGKITQRATTRCGGRNMQDSTFSLSGSQIDDNKPIRSSIRPQQPPGGVSTFLW